MTTDVPSRVDCVSCRLRKIRRKMLKTVRLTPRMIKNATRDKIKNKSNGNIHFTNIIRIN